MLNFLQAKNFRYALFSMPDEYLICRAFRYGLPNKQNVLFGNSWSFQSLFPQCARQVKVPVAFVEAPLIFKTLFQNNFVLHSHLWNRMIFVTSDVLQVQAVGVVGNESFFLKFCMHRKSALCKGQTAFESPLCLGTVSKPVLSRLGCGLCGWIGGLFTGFCCFIVWILLQ